MKLKTTALAAAFMAVVMLISSPAYAEKVAVSDATLDSIMGEGNNISSVGGANYSSVTGVNANGNIQIGSYQWTDDHSSDASINKGANVQSGYGSQVQQNASTIANALSWGAIAQSVTTNTADVKGDQVTESWAVMYIGGF